MNILVITFWSYKDALIQTYTLPYLKLMSKHLPANSNIYLLTLETKNLQISKQEAQQIEEELKPYRIIRVPFTYHRFGVRAMLTWSLIITHLYFLIWKKNIQTIHSFCTTAGAAGWLLSKLTGKKLILDSYEPHAEACVENGDWQPQNFRFRLLFTLEKLQSRRAQIIISATQGMRQYALKKYGVTFDQFYVKPACVNLELFSKKNRKNPQLIEKFGFQDKIVCVYAGKFGGIYLDHEVFGFLKVASNFWGEKFSVLILTNHKEDDILRWCEQYELKKSVVQTAFVPHAEIPNYIGLGDFALTPVKPIPTKRYCTPIKNGEYWALGLPVVSTKNISDDSEIIENEQIGAILREFTPKDYLRVVSEIDHLLNTVDRDELYEKVRSTAKRYRSFEIANNIYQTIYGT